MKLLTAHQSLMLAFYEAMSERLGDTPQGLMRRYPVTARKLDRVEGPPDRLDGASFYQFAGARAVGADLFAKSSAQALLAQGRDAQEVRRETGWFVGVDGQWRFEIDDSEASLLMDGQVGQALDELAGEGMRPVVLSDILNHPRLFAAYPDLQRLVVEVTPPEVAVAGRLVVSRGAQVLQLNAALIGHECLRVIVHEVQHAIQEVEGFAGGGSVEVFRDRDVTDAAVRPIDRAIGELMDSDAVYGNLVRAKNREFIRLADRYGYDGVGSRKGERGLNWDDVPEIERDAYFALLDRLDEFAQHVELFDLESQRRTILRERVIETAHDQYTRLAGEVEARNTESRIGFSQAMRMEVSPACSADVPDEKVIVRFNGLGGVKALDSCVANVGAKALVPSIRGRATLDVGPDGGVSLIEYFDGADEATVVHESAHYFLEVLGQLALQIQFRIRCGASVSVQELDVLDDFNLLLDWFSVDGGVDEWVSMGVEQRRVHHERFASGFERYVSDGSAPRASLVGLFERVSVWVKQLCSLVDDLDVEVPDRVKRVMGKMVGEQAADVSLRDVGHRC